MLVAAKKPAKPMPSKPKGPKCYLPTPEQIRAKCEEIRNGWSEDMEKMRRVQKSPAVEAFVRKHHTQRTVTSN